MKIAKSSKTTIETASFSAEIANNELFLPIPIVDILSKYRITTAEQLIHSCLNFPNFIVSVLNWHYEDVVSATNELAQVLTPYLDEELLKPIDLFERGFGVINIDENK